MPPDVPAVTLREPLGRQGKRSRARVVSSIRTRSRPPWGATLDFWLTLGPEGEAFERELAALLGVKHSLLVNSGSSANLIAFSVLTTHKLPAHKRILLWRRGDHRGRWVSHHGHPNCSVRRGTGSFVDNDPATG